VTVHALLLVGQVGSLVFGAPAVARPATSLLPDSVVRDPTRAAVTDTTRHVTTMLAPDSVGGTGGGDSLLGRSGKLRARFILATEISLVLPVLRHFFGDTDVSQPGVYGWQDGLLHGHGFSLITLLPFKTKARGRVGDYRVGWWPAEHHRLRSIAYENPNGFIRVTPDNQDTPVSDHFRLRDFLTHDQRDVWPKYIVLKEALVDKLELIIDDLAAHGHPDAHLVIMSGFRTPEYNARGVGARGGRARDSRHQFGDAADIYVDDDGDGVMDDLNGDGRVDSRDARVLLASVDRVETAHPELVGGAGVYHGTRAHGPFLHVDVRGEAVRWKVDEPRRRHPRTSKTHSSRGQSQGGTR
jgi:uncharacterized protein YcbK (DUF882 family)